MKWYEWVFGGIGATVVGLILALPSSGRSSVKQKLKAGDRSTNIQVGGDVIKRDNGR